MTNSEVNTSGAGIEGTTRIPYAQGKVRANLRRMLISVLCSVGALVFISFREEQHLGQWQQMHRVAGIPNWSFEFSLGAAIFGAIVALGLAILKLARLRDTAVAGADFLNIGPSGIGSAEFTEKLRWRDIAGFSVSNKKHNRTLVIHTRSAPESIWQRLGTAMLRNRFKAPAGVYPVVLKADAIDYPLESLQTLLLSYLERYGKVAEPARQKSVKSDARHRETRRG